jgi:hypothetical protein
VIDLPAPLPEGERILWEGSPRPWAFFRQIVHPQLLGTYVAVLVAWCIVTGVHSGAPLVAFLAAAKFTGLSVVAILLLVCVSRLQAGATDYIITNRRIMITFGAALGKTLQIPFSKIEAASVREHADGSGDLVLRLIDGQRVSFIMLWPNVRPWRLYPAQPMLRALPDAQAAAQILARALAAHAGMAPVALVDANSHVAHGTMAAAA